LSEKTTYSRFLEEFNKNTVTDRLDYCYALLEALRTINIMRVDPDVDPERIDAAIETLRDLFPDSKRDEQFKKDVEDSFDLITVDTRTEADMWCGVMTGKPRMKTFKQINHSKLLHACVNLIDRMDLGLKTENKGFVGRRE
jgi:hypothetical protein